MFQNEALTQTHFVVLNGREFYESCEIWYCTLGVVYLVFFQLQTGDLFLLCQKTILDLKLKVGNKQISIFKKNLGVVHKRCQHFFQIF